MPQVEVVSLNATDLITCYGNYTSKITCNELSVIGDTLTKGVDIQINNSRTISFALARITETEVTRAPNAAVGDYVEMGVYSVRVCTTVGEYMAAGEYMPGECTAVGECIAAL